MVEYDFIIKLENLDVEQKYFVENIEISKQYKRWDKNRIDII